VHSRLDEEFAKVANQRLAVRTAACAIKALSGATPATGLLSDKSAFGTLSLYKCLLSSPHTTLRNKSMRSTSRFVEGSHDWASHPLLRILHDPAGLALPAPQ